LAEDTLQGDAGLVVVGAGQQSLERGNGRLTDLAIGHQGLEPLGTLRANPEKAALPAAVTCEKGEREGIGLGQAVAEDRSPQVTVDVRQDGEGRRQHGKADGGQGPGVGRGQEGRGERQLRQRELQPGVEQRHTAHQVRVAFGEAEAHGAYAVLMNLIIMKCYFKWQCLRVVPA
jgi:hypothetical protein